LAALGRLSRRCRLEVYGLAPGRRGGLARPPSRPEEDAALRRELRLLRWVFQPSLWPPRRPCLASGLRPRAWEGSRPAGGPANRTSPFGPQGVVNPQWTRPAGGSIVVVN
jgi:hypothetical protein